MKRWFAADSLASCQHPHHLYNVTLTAMSHLSAAQFYQLVATVDTQTEEVAALTQLRMQLGALWLLRYAAEIDEFQKNNNI